MPKKENLPAMPWYWGDWFKAMDVQALPRDVRCVWFEMCGRMWESNERGYLTINSVPMSDAEKARALGFGDDVKKYLKYEKVLGDKKIFSRRESDGAIYSRKILDIIDLKEKRAAAGKIGGSKTQSKAKSKPESENETENKIDLFKNELNREQIFEEARKAYPGTKRGLSTEWKNFQKKYKKELAEILPLLLPAIKAKIEHRKSLREANAFCPEWPHFQTWINNRRWEEQPGEVTKPPEKEQIKSFDERKEDEYAAAKRATEKRLGFGAGRVQTGIDSKGFTRYLPPS